MASANSRSGWVSPRARSTGLPARFWTRGFLQQNPETGRYGLGVGLFSLGSLVRSRLDVTIESKHILNGCANARRRTCASRSCSATASSSCTTSRARRPFGFGRPRVNCSPAFCTAEGLCLISGLRPPQLEQFLAIPAPQRTSQTVTEEDALRCPDQARQTARLRVRGRGMRRGHALRRGPDLQR